MRFQSTLCFLSTLLATAVAAPTDLSVIEARQSGLNNNKGNLPVGVVISKCTVPGTIALAFDDGPHENTDRALDLLDKAGMKGTFFFNGQNYRNLVDFKPTLERMIRDKHQIGSHTWNHPHLNDLTKSVVRAQMIKIEEHLLPMIGRYPLYMRPPFLEANDKVLGYLRDLDYKVISRDVETMDWADNAPNSMALFRKALDDGGRLVLAHEPRAITIDILLPKMIQEVQKRGLKAVTVGTCLGDHSNNWYSKVVRKV